MVARKGAPPVFEGPNPVQSVAVTDAGQVRFVSTTSLVEWTPATSATTSRPIPLDALYQTASKATPKLVLGKEGELSIAPMQAPTKCIGKSDCKVNPEATDADVAFEISDDGQRVLFSACESAVFPALCALSVFDFASGAVVAKLFSAGWAGGVARHLSPKGAYVVLVGVNRTEMVRLETEKSVFSSGYTLNDFPRFRFIADHNVLFSAAGELRVVDLLTGKLVSRKVLAGDSEVVLGPDGRLVLFTGPAGYAVWSATTGITLAVANRVPSCTDCKAEWTSERHIRLSGQGRSQPDLFFDVVAKAKSEVAEETAFSSEGFTVSRNLRDGTLHVTTPNGTRAPLEATSDAPHFTVGGGRLFAQCWAWAKVVEADGSGHSFPRTQLQAH